MPAHATTSNLLLPPCSRSAKWFCPGHVYHVLLYRLLRCTYRPSPVPARRRSAVVVIGNLHGKVGVGCSSGREVSTAVKRALVDARKNVVTVPITSSGSIPHRVCDSCAFLTRPFQSSFSEGFSNSIAGALPHASSADATTLKPRAQSFR